MRRWLDDVSSVFTDLDAARRDAARRAAPGHPRGLRAQRRLEGVRLGAGVTRRLRARRATMISALAELFARGRDEGVLRGDMTVRRAAHRLGRADPVPGEPDRRRLADARRGRGLHAAARAGLRMRRVRPRAERGPPWPLEEELIRATPLSGSRRARPGVRLTATCRSHARELPASNVRGQSPTSGSGGREARTATSPASPVFSTIT